MAYDFTLAEAIARVEFLGDLQGLSARHDAMGSEVLQAFRELRELTLALGWKFYRRLSSDISLPVPTSSLPNVSVVSVGFAERVLDVALTVSTSFGAAQYALENGSPTSAGFIQASRLRADAWLPRTQDPRERPEYLPRWEVFALDGVTDTSSSGPETTSALWVFPASAAIIASGAPKLQVTYLPHVAPVTNTTHKLRFPHPAGYTWLCARVAW